jgi:hypothetical protein
LGEGVSGVISRDAAKGLPRGGKELKGFSCAWLFAETRRKRVVPAGAQRRRGWLGRWICGIEYEYRPAG